METSISVSNGRRNPPNPQTVEAEPPPGPTFKEAVSEQLGLKLLSQTGPANFLVVDHIERPSGN
jgi:uncharacterized protein (TIGR03435 family)